VKGALALKSLDKAALVENSQQGYIRREIAALQTCDHPFVVEYYGVTIRSTATTILLLCLNFILGVCWTPRKLFILMEHVPGGELWAYLHGNGDAAALKYEKGPYGGLHKNSAALYIRFAFEFNNIIVTKTCQYVAAILF